MNGSSRTIAFFAALVVGALLALVAKGTSIASEERTTVIASQGRWDIDPSGVACLSLNRKIPNRIFGKDYSDDPRILTLLQLYFPNARVSANDPNCQYMLTFNVNTDHLGAARLLGRTAKTLATIVITQAPIPQGQISSYKNIYVFRDDLTPLQLVEVGLKAFLQPQDRSWQTLAVMAGKP